MKGIEAVGGGGAGVGEEVLKIGVRKQKHKWVREINVVSMARKWASPSKPLIFLRADSGGHFQTFGSLCVGS